MKYEEFEKTLLQAVAGNHDAKRHDDQQISNDRQIRARIPAYRRPRSLLFFANLL